MRLKSLRTPAIVAAAIAAAVLLFLAFRPGDDEPEARPPASPPPTAETTTTTTPRPRPPREVVVNVVVRGGRPRGGIRRVTVAKGRRVVLVVRSDVADHVHLHGYDVMRNVAPGSPARIRFRAMLPGRFEVELEDRGIPLALITVRA